MKKITFFLIMLAIVFSGCDRGCQDENACNYGVTTEPCKDAEKQEAVLVGEWFLVDIHDSDDSCIFSESDQWDCELDDLIESITLEFNENKTCDIDIISSDISNNFITGDWSINPCYNTLDFSYSETTIVLPDYWPFGYFKIIELYGDTFICEDLDGSTLRWERS